MRTGEGSCHQDGQGGIRRSINATSRSARCFASSWQVCDSSENPATAFHGHPLCLKIFDSRLFLPFMPVAHRHYPLVEPVAVLRWPGHLCRATLVLCCALPLSCRAVPVACRAVPVLRCAVPLSGCAVPLLCRAALVPALVPCCSHACRFASSWQVCHFSELKPRVTTFDAAALFWKDFGLFRPFMRIACRHYPIAEPVVALPWPDHSDDCTAVQACSEWGSRQGCWLPAAFKQVQAQQMAVPRIRREQARADSQG